MMCTVMWLAGVLGCFTVALALPGNLGVRQQSTQRPCEDLGIAFFDMMQLREPFGFNLVPRINSSTLFQWLTSIDSTNREQMFEVTCNIVGGISAVQAIDYLEGAGILETVIRRVYDIVVITIETYKPMLERWLERDRPHADASSPEALVLQMWNILEEIGFTDLDPQGVQEARAFRDHILAGGRPGRPGKRNAPGVHKEPMSRGVIWPGGFIKRQIDPTVEASGDPYQCQTLKSIINQVIPDLFGSSDPYSDAIVGGIRMVTGINLRDSEAIGQFVCEATSADSIAQILAAFRSRNIFVNMMDFALNGLQTVSPKGYPYRDWLRWSNLSDQDIEDYFPPGTEVRERSRIYLRMLQALDDLDMLASSE